MFHAINKNISLTPTLPGDGGGGGGVGQHGWVWRCLTNIDLYITDRPLLVLEQTIEIKTVYKNKIYDPFTN